MKSDSVDILIVGVYEWIVRVLMFKLEARNEEIKYKQQIIQDAYKDRNEAIRRYNALHQLGKFAEDMGVDLTEKLPEHEFNIPTLISEKI